MSSPAVRWLSALACGGLFAVGLGISGMTRPSKIIGFLDVGGAWDPSLLAVMGGALLVGGFTFPLILARRGPVLGDEFHVPARSSIDGRLILGAALFGIGWGLSGYCPGPALVSLVALKAELWIFVVCMLAGLALGRRLDRSRS